MDEIQINKIAEQLAGSTLQWSIGLYQSVFKGIEPVKYTYQQVSDICRKVGINDIRHLDYDYYTTTIDNWRRIIESTYFDRITYIAEKIDCDNFAKLFASMGIVLLGGINSCGTVYGDYILGSNKPIRHYFNIILTSDGKLWIYEPMNDLYTELASTEIKLGHADYRILSATFF